MSSEFRAKAREKLSGKWGKSALIILAYYLVFLIINIITSFIGEESALSSIISLALFIIEIPLGFGLVFSLFKLYKGEDTTYFEFLNLGFSNFKRAWGITWQMFLKMLLPIVLMIISYILIIVSVSMSIYSLFISSSAVGTASLLLLIGGILLVVSSIWSTILSYYYQLSYFIAIDNPDLTSKESVLKSRELMTNNRWNLFKLQFSFIGWIILSAFTFGIGLLWVAPYMLFSIISFYESLISNGADVAE